MGPHAIPEKFESGLEQVRSRLLTALHLGRSKPGDRAPSIRRMAELAGLNHKTVHRAYRHLADEGMLDVRWGSGTFFSESRKRTAHKPLPGSLLDAVERCRVEADHLGVAPDVFLRVLDMLMGKRLQAIPIAVAECNREQIGLIERELRGGLGLVTHEVLISDLVAHHPSLMSRVRGVVTTDCHREEVTEMVAPLGIPVYRVALAPEFTYSLIRYAREGAVLMIVRDPGYGPVFLRMLRNMQVPREIVERFKIVGAEESESCRRALRTDASVYVSPLVARDLSVPLPQTLTRIRPGRYLAPASIDRLKAQMALDLALQPE